MLVSREEEVEFLGVVCEGSMRGLYLCYYYPCVWGGDYSGGEENDVVRLISMVETGDQRSAFGSNSSLRMWRLSL